MDADPWALERRYISQDCLQALDDFSLPAAKGSLTILKKPRDLRGMAAHARHSILVPTQLQESSESSPATTACTFSRYTRFCTSSA